MNGRSWFGWLALALILAAVALSGCFPFPLGCRSTWFRRCAPMPQGTIEECARGLLPEPSLPYWYQVPEENWQAAKRACSACMMDGDTAATCSRRMWGTKEEAWIPKDIQAYRNGTNQSLPSTARSFYQIIALQVRERRGQIAQPSCYLVA